MADNNLKIMLTGVTDVGHHREVNEDGFALCLDAANPDWTLTQTESPVILPDSGSVIIVADGMGGAAAGEVASAIAIETVEQLFDYTTEMPDDMLADAIRRADEAINHHVDTAPETTGMGTTIVVAWLRDDQATVAWCGDSRCYRYRPGEGLMRVSHDHSYVQDLVDMGQITEDEALTHPESNIITRCLGDTGTEPEPEVTRIDLQTDDLLLICSDGLCGYCADSAIEDVLNRYHDDPAVCQEALLQMALDAGGYDNITIALAAMVDSPAQPSGFTRWLKRLF